MHQVLFCDWRASLESFEPLAWDLTVFSDIHGYAGSVDLMARVSDRHPADRLTRTDTSGTARPGIDRRAAVSKSERRPEQDYFADGMVEEIITALSRIRWLLVIARNSSFTYKGRAVDVKQVGKELGVMYVLEGSVRKAGNRIRINKPSSAPEPPAYGQTQAWQARMTGADNHHIASG
jgi:TolB-like protein